MRYAYLCDKSDKETYKKLVLVQTLVKTLKMETVCSFDYMVPQQGGSNIDVNCHEKPGNLETEL
jgi:hypothetical protein